MARIEPPVCVALDVPTLDDARRLVKQLTGTINLFKIGLELFCAEGPRTVEVVREAGADVFLDLKVNDIPRTAAAAVREAGKLRAAYLTVHGFGGREMIRASVESAGDGGPELLVVTALTSFDDETLREIGVERGVTEQALAIGRIAAEEGARGLILSPRELDVVRNALPHLLLATPGVRPAGTASDDHRRVLTPADAILAGADLVVVGRPVTQATDPAGAARALVDEIQGAEATREHRGRAEETASPEETEDAELEEGSRERR